MAVLSCFKALLLCLRFNSPRSQPKRMIQSLLVLVPRGFLLLQLILDVLLDEVRVRSNDAATVDEDCGRAGNLERQAVCVAGVDCGGGFRAGQAGLEGVRIQADL